MAAQMGRKDFTKKKMPPTALFHPLNIIIITTGRGYAATGCNVRMLIQELQSLRVGEIAALLTPYTDIDFNYGHFLLSVSALLLK